MFILTEVYNPGASKINGFYANFMLLLFLVEADSDLN